MKKNLRGLILFPILIAFFSFTENAKAQCTAVIGANTSQGCETLTVQFNDLSTGAVQSRLWNFGDGSPTSGAQSPTHSFSAGVIGDTVYNVKLVIQCISSGSDSVTQGITVYKKPNVLFVANKSTVCVLSDSICFTNNSSTGVGYSYLWNFGDGFTSPSFSPCHVYATPAPLYTVQLSITSNHSCFNSGSVSNFSAIASPNPDFSISPILGCTPQVVTIVNTTDTVSSVISLWSWDFGDGSPLYTGSQPASHTYSTTGTYFIKLTATNSLGCSNRTIKALVVHTSPVATITATTPLCVYDSSLVVFTGAAGTNAVYTWNFAGGIAVPGTGIGPHKINWTAEGIHTVSLTVTDSSCISKTTIPILVNPRAVISLSVSPNDTICLGQSVIFTATPGNYLRYDFYLNNVLVQSSSNNIYQSSALLEGDQVKVFVVNLIGCTNTSNTITIHVKPIPASVLTSSNPIICTAGVVTFTATPSGLSNYTFYDGSSVLQSGISNTYTFTNAPNGHIVSVISTNTVSCLSPVSNTIAINVIPRVLPPVVNCGTTTANSIQFVWDSVYGADAYEVSVAGGTYTVASSGSTGLSHLISGLSPNDVVSIVVRALGGAPCFDTAYSAATQCTATPCTAVTFSYPSLISVCKGTNVTVGLTNINASHFSVSWNGGAYSSSTTYSTTAINNATVTVNILDSAQLSCPPAKGIIVIQVISTPSVTITSNAVNDSICEGDNLIFTTAPSNLTNYDFYNGSLLLQSGVNNTFTTASLLNGNAVKVVGADASCSATANAPTIIIVQPLSSPQVVCDVTTTSSVSFVWNSIPGATGYLVSVNGGPFISPSTGVTGLTHTVTGLNPGDAATIIVQALANNVCGNSPISVPVTCFATDCAVIDFTLNSNLTLCKGDTATLVISNISISPFTASWQSGSPAAIATYTIVPTSDTFIIVKVLNPNEPACVPSIKYCNIHVIEKPSNVTVTSSTANDSICKGSILTFTASPAGYSHYAFYDGFLLLQYTNSNTYQTNNWVNGHTLTVLADNQGCVGTISNGITTAVIDPLNTPQVNCGNSTNTSIEFVWNSVPGSSGYQVSVNGGAYTTPSSGSNGLSHLITGLTFGDTRTIVVKALGKAPCGNSSTSAIHSCQAIPCTAITYSVSPSLYISTCQNNVVTLSLSTISTLSPSISWNSAAAVTTTTFSFVVTTNTVVTVSVTDLVQPSCNPTSNQFIITAIPTPSVAISSSATNDSTCQGQAITITASPAGYSNYAFYNSTTLLQNSSNPNYATSGLLSGNSLYVIATNNACTSTSSSKSIVVSPVPTVTVTSSASTDTSCFGDTIIFTALPSGYHNYIFYNGLTVLQNSASNILNLSTLPVGITNTITVAATNNGCSGNSANSITTVILSLPVVTLTSSDPNDTICTGAAVTFTASPSGLSNYTFYNGTTVLQNSASNSYSINSLISGNSITAKGTNSKGCTSISSNAIVTVIKPAPSPILNSLDTGICVGIATSISVSLVAPFTSSSLVWNTGATSSSISVSPTATTVYNVAASYQGCAGVDTIKIYVDNATAPLADAGNAATVCIGDSIQLNGNGGINYQWSPSISLSDSMSKNPYATPTHTTMYVLKVTNTYCFNKDSVLIYIDKCLKNITGPIPSVITPNGDGSNDYFSIPDVDYFTTNELNFYNRWGNLVYTAKPYSNNWNGVSSNGKDLADGIYYYVLDLGNGNSPVTGYVLIKR